MSRTNATQADREHMLRALALARRGRGAVEPNPMVGCVIVKNGRVIGEGWHRRFGGPHAEIDALRRCRVAPHGATLYVTLEPCSHFGKTPPCADALVEARIGRVIAALRDPNPLVAGRGLRRLRRAGIEVASGVLAAEATSLNAPYLKLLRERRPWVILKWAQSLDGKIATRTHDSKWISDEACRTHAHRVRGRVDAIIVGRHTVETDDPELTARLARPRRIATRVVLDARLSTPPTACLIRTAQQTPTLFFCGQNAPAARRRTLEHAGCRVDEIPCDGKTLSLGAALDRLGELRMTNVLVEGGGALLGAFADQNLADEIHVYVAPLLIGGRDAVSPLSGLGVETVARSPRLPADTTPRRIGAGWLFQARLPRSPEPTSWPTCPINRDS